MLPRSHASTLSLTSAINSRFLEVGTPYTSTESTNKEGWDSWFSIANFNTEGEPLSLSLNMPTYFVNIDLSSSRAS
jgi:hypothetical protein